MLNLRTGKNDLAPVALTRRDFGKGLAAILAAGCAPAIASAAARGAGGNARMGGMRGAAVGGGMIGQKLPYPTEGLTHCYDGLWNVGRGLWDATSSTWKDLIGSIDIELVNGAAWGNHYVYKSAVLGITAMHTSQNPFVANRATVITISNGADGHADYSWDYILGLPTAWGMQNNNTPLLNYSNGSNNVFFAGNQTVDYKFCRSVMNAYRFKGSTMDAISDAWTGTYEFSTNGLDITEQSKYVDYGVGTSRQYCAILIYDAVLSDETLAQIKTIAKARFGIT